MGIIKLSDLEKYIGKLIKIKYVREGAQEQKSTGNVVYVENEVTLLFVNRENDMITFKDNGGRGFCWPIGNIVEFKSLD